jgi:Flp pilus assembly pilin Flp
MVFRSLLSSQLGASLAEVALLLCLIAVIAIPAVGSLGPRAGDTLCKAGLVVEHGGSQNEGVVQNILDGHGGMCCVGGVWHCHIHGLGGCPPQNQVSCTPSGGQSPP